MIEESDFKIVKCTNCGQKTKMKKNQNPIHCNVCGNPWFKEMSFEESIQDDMEETLTFI